MRTTVVVFAAATAIAVPVAAQAAPAAAPATSTPAQARAAVRSVPTRDVVIHNPYVAKDRLAKGWKVIKKASAKPEIDACTDPSPAGRGPNTYMCGSPVYTAVACFKKPGYTNVLTCVVDPTRRTLVEYRTRGAIKPSRVAPPVDRRPIAAVLADGQLCHLRTGGGWAKVDPEGRYGGWAWCERKGKESDTLYQKSEDGSSQYRVQGRTIQYHVGRGGVYGSLRWMDVRTRYWIA